MSEMWRHGWRRLVLAGTLFVVAACGSRVSDEQRLAALGGAPSAVGSSATSAAEGGLSDDGASASGAGGTSSAGATASTLAGAGATAPRVAAAGGNEAAATAAHSADNGGATEVGVTGDTLTVGNVSTLSGPVPGLFAGAVIGTQAWAAYQNSVGGIGGRRIKIEVRDDQFDSGQNRAATQDLIPKVFAFVGSFSLYDDSGLPAMESAKVPDLQVPLTVGLQRSPVNFSVNPVAHGAYTGAWNAMKAKYPDSIQFAGGIYSDIPAAKDNFLNTRHAAETVGYKWVYTRGYQATETDFTADVVRMRQAGVRFFFTSGDVKTVARIAKTMQQQNFHPDVFMAFTAYDSTFFTLAGSAADGITILASNAMYMGEDASSIPEVALMDRWINKVKPGYKPDLFAAYGWTEGRLFAKAMEGVGPKATRAALFAALKKIDAWDSYGLLAPVGVASKRPTVCWIFMRIRNGKFERFESPAPKFRCDNSTFVNR
jgi:ABC-type branched-subunit amino acid transport system substrate-binding protein